VSTPAPEHGDAITATLLLMTQHAERLAVLDEREGGHYREIGERLAELARLAAETSNRLDDIHATTARQAAILDTLDGLDRHVAALADKLTSMTTAQDADAEDGQEYRPALAARWWKIDGDEREDAMTRLRAWVEQVYRPGYGHLAAALGRCWEQHSLCLYGLDWLMELWSALYLTGARNGPVLASQAEWQTRLLPALAEQMHVETTRCQHAQTTPGQRQPYRLGRGSEHAVPSRWDTAATP
jgi:hypothetical protein